MTRHLPPLNALRAFEAAARHGSFSAAADELHVTHAAISHQIRALEDWFGMRLFKRTPGRVELVTGGRIYGQHLTRMFDQLDAKTLQLKSKAEQHQLTMKVDPQFAAVWLVPRLVTFFARNPDVELDVVTEEGVLDPRGDEAPMAIIYLAPGERIDETDVNVECLCRVSAFPACRPDLLKNSPVERVEDLLNHTLLHGEDRDWWRTWFAAAGIETVDPLPGPQFSQSYLALLAAKKGQGVALLDDIEAADSLRAGQVVRLFDVHFDGGSYVIVRSALVPQSNVMVVVRNWLHAEMGSFLTSTG